MAGYSDHDQLNDPLGLLQVIATQRAGGIAGIMNEIRALPTEYNFQKSIKEMEVFKREDPSQYYEPMHKMGSGGFAQVFKVKRNSDGKFMALKLMEPRNQKERDMMLNECALM